jgi:hypothetical protein
LTPIAPVFLPQISQITQMGVCEVPAHPRSAKLALCGISSRKAPPPAKVFPLNLRNQRNLRPPFSSLFRDILKTRKIDAKQQNNRHTFESPCRSFQASLASGLVRRG